MLGRTLGAKRTERKKTKQQELGEEKKRKEERKKERKEKIMLKQEKCFLMRHSVHRVKVMVERVREFSTESLCLRQGMTFSPP